MFAILFEVLLIEIQEEIHHFAGWEGGGVKWCENCEQKFCEQTGVSYFSFRQQRKAGLARQGTNSGLCSGKMPAAP